MAPRVFTIGTDDDFLNVLAAAIMAGFPRDGGPPPDRLSELPRWTILLPTRRAVRELEQIFTRHAKAKGTLLPRIRPIGDIDEDVLGGDAARPDVTGLPDAVTTLGRELMLMSLIDEWALQNEHLPLAAEINSAPARALGMAVTLADFIDGLETEEIDGRQIAALIPREWARHREAILDFLSLAQVRLPQKLHELKLLGPKQRQALVLRHEARRLIAAPPKWPVIAAGSTGSIPATRELLKAIAQLPLGAVVLPGLDTGLDEASWQAAGPQHPQFILKQLVAALGVARDDVQRLGAADVAPRATLVRHFMRPPDTSDQWRRDVAMDQRVLRDGLQNITLVEAANRVEESLAIAMMLREALNTPGRTASLITPDRDLARRVKQDLRRWSIDIDDSAGEPLINFGGAAFAGLLLDVIDSDFSAETLNALFQHPLCSLDLAPDDARRAAQLVELGLFRSGLGLGPLQTLDNQLQHNRAAIAADRHAHPAFLALSEADWELAIDFAARAKAHLIALDRNGNQSFAFHFTALMSALEAMAGPALWEGDPGHLFRELMTLLATETSHAGPCPLSRVTAVVRRHLSLTPYRPQRGLAPRLAILGLLEARLLRADLHVLGGLNEGAWPALPDAGPWLNRPMRDELGLQQPERSIGQTGHDFVQALGAKEAILVWSKRVGGAPVLPSRWILRLRMMADKVRPADATPRWLTWARAIDAEGEGGPWARPQPKPPVAARPRKLSVTQIETLMRDPYAIYARQVLRLEPMTALGDKPGPALRGTLIHAAIGTFLEAFPHILPADAEAQLLTIAKPLFALHADKPIVRALWWPRFANMARWLVAEERQMRPALVAVHAEVGGALDLETAGGRFRLTGRADRIDVLRDGTARIIDYKTGSVPSGPQVQSGLAPQLTLEAAMVKRGAFNDVPKIETSELQYVKLSGGEPPGSIEAVSFKSPVADVAEQHLARLVGLLDGYARPGQPYYPRHIAETDDAVLDYDHLSRYREWILAGQKT